jgi:hypothetical protein
MINSPLSNYPSVEHVANVERMLNLLNVSDEVIVRSFRDFLKRTAHH